MVHYEIVTYGSDTLPHNDSPCHTYVADIRDKVPIRSKHVLKALGHFGAVPPSDLENRPKLLKWIVDKNTNQEVLVPVCDIDDGGDSQLVIDAPIINIAPQEEDESKAGFKQQDVTESTPATFFVYDKGSGEFRPASSEEAEGYAGKVKNEDDDDGGEEKVALVKEENGQEKEEDDLPTGDQEEAGGEVEEKEPDAQKSDKASLPHVEMFGGEGEAVSVTTKQQLSSARQQVMSVSVVTEEGEPVGETVLVQVGEDGKLRQVLSKQDSPKKMRKKEPRLTGPRKTIIQTKRYK